MVRMQPAAIMLNYSVEDTWNDVQQIYIYMKNRNWTDWCGSVGLTQDVSSKDYAWQASLYSNELVAA